MALVQVKEVVRKGLVQKVARFVSPPNPSGPASCLWKADSLSKQKRALLANRMIEYRTSFFSTTPAAGAELHTSTTAQRAADASPEESPVTSSGASSSEADAVLLDRSYGQEQADHKKVAEDSHEHYEATKDEGEPETLESTSFDISKATRPSGAE